MLDSGIDPKINATYGKCRLERCIGRIKAREISETHTSVAVQLSDGKRCLLHPGNQCDGILRADRVRLIWDWSISRRCRRIAENCANIIRYRISAGEKKIFLGHVERQTATGFMYTSPCSPLCDRRSKSQRNKLQLAAFWDRKNIRENTVGICQCPPFFLYTSLFFAIECTCLLADAGEMQRGKKVQINMTTTKIDKYISTITAAR